MTKYQFEAGDYVWEERPKCSYCGSEAELATPIMGIVVCFKEKCAGKFIRDKCEQIVEVGNGKELNEPSLDDYDEENGVFFNKDE